MWRSVPAYNFLDAGTVPAFNFLDAGTVPASNPFYSIESTYVRLYGQWAPHLAELHEG